LKEGKIFSLGFSHILNPLVNNYNKQQRFDQTFLPDVHRNIHNITFSFQILITYVISLYLWYYQTSYS